MTRRRGFTLLELVVALAVTAATMVVLQRALADALRARGTLAGDVARRGASSAAFVHLVRELGGAVPGSLRIAPRTTEAPPLLEFAVDEPAPAVVRYRVVERRLERTMRPRFAVVETPEQTTVFLPDVAALTARAQDADGWHDAWEDTHAPSAVALELALVSGERLATRLPVLPGGPP